MCRLHHCRNPYRRHLDGFLFLQQPLQVWHRLPRCYCGHSAAGRKMNRPVRAPLRAAGCRSRVWCRHSSVRSRRPRMGFHTRPSRCRCWRRRHKCHVYLCRGRPGAPAEAWRHPGHQQHRHGLRYRTRWSCRRFVKQLARLEGGIPRPAALYRPRFDAVRGRPRHSVGAGPQTSARPADYAGSACLVLSIVLLLVGFSSGGNEASWGHPLVWVTILLAVVFSVIFVLVELYYAQQPILPLALLSHRTVWSGCLTYFFAYMAAFRNYVLHPYLPLGPRKRLYQR